MSRTYPPVMVSFDSVVFSFEKKTIVPKFGKNKGKECVLCTWSSPMPTSDCRSLGGNSGNAPSTLWVRCAYFGDMPQINKFDVLSVVGQFRLTDYGLEFVVLDFNLVSQDGE